MAIINIDKNNFKETVLKQNGTVVIDFWASWCMPCKMFAPVYDVLAEENENVTFCKINVDDEPELAAKFGIQSIPTVVVIKDGIIKEVLTGLRNKDEIEALLG
ncbi:MAG: thioredoxin [Clostridia bacterium]|nr:thioredoxin [Clostridia bacterium]